MKKYDPLLLDLSGALILVASVCKCVIFKKI